MRNGNNKCTLCPSGFFGKNPYTMRSVMIKDFYTNFCGTRKTSSTSEEHRPPFLNKRDRKFIGFMHMALLIQTFYNFQMINYIIMIKVKVLWII